MFYQLEDEIVSVEYDNIKDNSLVLGIVSIKELEKIYKHFNLPLQALEILKNQQNGFKNGAKAFDGCWLIKICYDSNIAMLILKNAVIIVSIDDNGRFNRDIFMSIVSRIQTDNVGTERLALLFFDALVRDDGAKLEKIRADISNLEEGVITNNADEKFNIRLLEIKKKILSVRYFYERLIDILEMLEENENEIFDDKFHFSNFRNKISRLKGDADVLTDSVAHLWDAYQAYMEIQLNSTMKVFTLVTTIFFPLTVIVGWYGMNFSFMPELRWRYGYIYVICLSITVIGILIYWFKKKKWL